MTAPDGQIVAEVRGRFGARTFLSFSRGKDSIAAYLAIRDSFDEVIPYHLFLVPDLEFVAESLAYFEKVMGRRIWDMPHPAFYKWLNRYTFQTPGRAAVIEAALLPNFDYNDVVKLIAKAEGVDWASVMVANGVRAADSPMRRLQFAKHGAISPATHRYSPVWDWDKEKLIGAIAKAKIALPVDYELFARTFDGLDYRFLAPLKKHRPRDYAKVLEWFPLAELEVWRYEKAAA